MKHLDISDDNHNISDEDKEEVRRIRYNMLMSIISFDNLTKVQNTKCELVLNKLQQIYPSV